MSDEGPGRETKNFEKNNAERTTESELNDVASKRSKTRSEQVRERPKDRQFGPLQAIGWVFALGLLAAGVLVGVVAYRLLSPPAPPSVEIVHDSPDVVVAIRDLARLETASAHVERVVDLRQEQTALLGLVETHDAILLIAAADARAGVDLTQMQDGDVIIEPEAGRATIVLPPPEVFDARLDNERTYVHSRDTGRLATPDARLETRARQEAERRVRAAAVEGGLLERARTNAVVTIETFVRALGYDHVEVRFADDVEENQVEETESEVDSPAESGLRR